MNLNNRLQEVVDDIGKIVGTEFAADQKKAVGKVVEDLVLEAMRESAASCSRAARACCSADEDMAHKVAREVEQAHTALIANLSSLR